MITGSQELTYACGCVTQLGSVCLRTSLLIYTLSLLHCQLLKAELLSASFIAKCPVPETWAAHGWCSVSVLFFLLLNTRI